MCIAGYGVRGLWKGILQHSRFKRERNNMLVVLTEKNADQIISQLLSDNRAGYDIVGVVLLETSNIMSVHGIPVVSDMKKVTQYIAKEWVDSVYIDAPINDRQDRKAYGFMRGNGCSYALSCSVHGKDRR